MKHKTRNFYMLESAWTNQAHHGTHVLSVKFIDPKYNFRLVATGYKELPSQIT